MKQHFLLVFLVLIPAELTANQEFLIEILTQTQLCNTNYGILAVRSLENALFTFQEKYPYYVHSKNQINKILAGVVNADEQLCLVIQSTSKSGDDVLRAMAACSIDETSVMYSSVKVIIHNVKNTEHRVCPGIDGSRNTFTTQASKMSSKNFFSHTAISVCEKQVIEYLVHCNYLDAKQMDNTSQVIAQMNKKLEGMSTDCRTHSQKVKCVLEHGRWLEYCSEQVRPLMSSELKKLLDSPVCDTDEIDSSRNPTSYSSVYLLIICLVISLGIFFSIKFFIKRI